MCPEKRQDQIVDHREIVKSGGQLKGPHHPHVNTLFWRHVGDVSPLIQNGPLIGLVIPGDEVEERRLPSSIGSDNTGHLVFTKDVVDVVNSDQFAKSLGDVFGLDDFCTCIRTHSKPLSRSPPRRDDCMDTGARRHLIYRVHERHY